jgi:hypothetical protein
MAQARLLDARLGWLVDQLLISRIVSPSALRAG